MKLRLICSQETQGFLFHFDFLEKIFFREKNHDKRSHAEKSWLLIFHCFLLSCLSIISITLHLKPAFLDYHFTLFAARVTQEISQIHELIASHS